MRAFDREVVDAVWEAVRGLLPERVLSHPLGCHRPRVSDRLCFWGPLVRLATGASWTGVEAILERRVSDTTLRSRRDEWIETGVFDRGFLGGVGEAPAWRDEWIETGVFDRLCSEALAAFDRLCSEALAAFDRVVGLDVSEVCVDGSIHKAPQWQRRNRQKPC